MPENCSPQSVIPFGQLNTRVHAITDASSVAELRKHSNTLTYKLNPTLAETLLQQSDESDLEASLNLLERWIVMDSIVVDVVAVDSLSNPSAVRSFRYKPSEFERIKRRGAQAYREAFTAHVTGDVLSRGLGVPDALNVSLTLIPPDVFDPLLL